MLLGMSNILKDLKEKLDGEVAIDTQTRDYFSTDGGIFKVTPKLVVYPRNEKDVIETLRFNYNLLDSNRALSVTARGKGTDQGGGSLSEGISIVFPAHMRKLVAIDSQTVTVQPGMIYSNLEDVLNSHGRFLPPYPASMDFCSIGGAIANNSSLLHMRNVRYGLIDSILSHCRVASNCGFNDVTTPRSFIL
jgi:FAD/FMN-containing dehydrogenase